MSDNNSRDPFKDVLSYEEQLPLRWHSIEGPLPSAKLERLDRENELLLKVLLSVDESGAEKDEETPETLSELKHLETKVNLLLNWLGTLIVQTAPLPERNSIKISEQGIAFNCNENYHENCNEALQIGQYVLMEWFPDEHYPQAIKLAAQILESVNESDTSVSSTRIIAGFTGMSDQVKDLIGKYIFRHHRRCIALQKRHKQDGSSS